MKPRAIIVAGGAVGCGIGRCLGFAASARGGSAEGGVVCRVGV